MAFSHFGTPSFGGHFGGGFGGGFGGSFPQSFGAYPGACAFPGTFPGTESAFGFPAAFSGAEGFSAHGFPESQPAFDQSSLPPQFSPQFEATSYPETAGYGAAPQGYAPQADYAAPQGYAPEEVQGGVEEAPESTDPNHEHALDCGHFYNTLGYWKIRGLAAPIRMMLAYQGVEYNNKFYEVEQLADGTWDRSMWLDHKENILKHNNPLINLPYLEAVDEEGGIVLAQSNAILAHLGRRFNLIGCSEIDAAKADMLLEQCHDLRQAFSKMCYGTKAEDFPKATEAYFGADGTFHSQIPKFEDWITAQNAAFLVEDEHPITADFVFWELLDIHLQLNPDCLNGYAKVSEFYDRFRNLPKLEEYFASELYALPINNKMANF